MILKNKDIYFSYWLLLITFLVGLMIFVGGLTRLTDSGLSITRWDLFAGILPPITNNEWDKLFSLYQQIPEYKLINYSMTLEEFKSIFWWEYIHRLLGRIIGLFYLLPLLFFTIKKKIKKKTLIFLYVIFGLILFQGFIGWYMVKSGLTEGVDVNHYKLAIHLTLAFIIYTLLLWNYIKYTYKVSPNTNKSLPTFLPFLFTFCILIQICIGALVSGLDAGQIYNTWPLMNNNYFPDDSFINDLFTKKVFETPSIIQFIHRNMAYLIVVIFGYILLKVFNDKKFIHLRNNILLILILIFLQIFLGIITLLSGVNIVLASMHQVGSIFLISASLLLVFKNYKAN